MFTALHVSTHCLRCGLTGEAPTGACRATGQAAQQALQHAPRIYKRPYLARTPRPQGMQSLRTQQETSHSSITGSRCPPSCSTSRKMAHARPHLSTSLKHHPSHERSQARHSIDSTPHLSLVGRVCQGLRVADHPRREDHFSRHRLVRPEGVALE